MPWFIHVCYGTLIYTLVVMAVVLDSSMFLLFPMFMAWVWWMDKQVCDGR